MNASRGIRLIGFWDIGAAKDLQGRSRAGTRVSATPKDQIARRPPFALRLGFIACGGKAGPWQAPVVGAFGGPLEIVRAHQMLQRPCGVVGPVGREAEGT